MVQDGRVLVGVVGVAAVAASVVTTWAKKGSPVRVGPRLRVPVMPFEAETLLSYDLRLDPSEEPPEGYKDTKWKYAPLGLVVTVSQGTSGALAFVHANWPTQHRDGRGRGPAARWPFVVATIDRGTDGGLRVSYGRKSKDAITKGGYKPIPVGFVEKEKGLLDALMDVAHHVMRSERSGPDVNWSTFLGRP
jgi:hypothetical protein